MTKRLREFLESGRSIRDALVTEAKQGSFAHQLAAISMDSHADELEQLRRVLEASPVFELIEFRLIASAFRIGSIPLRVVAQGTEEIRQMLGHAALRLVQGGLRRKRVPDYVYRELDLRLAGVLPGSARLLVTAAARRDLFDDGVSKDALERVFRVLATGGKGEDFLEAVTDLGPASSRRLRDFLKLLRANSAEMELSWRYSGNIVNSWEGNATAIEHVTSSLEVTHLKEREVVTLEGVIELLSKRERIHLRTDTGRVVRILFPKRLLDEVSTLHLDQKVRLMCQVTETENPLTNEVSIFYELLEIRG